MRKFILLLIPVLALGLFFSCEEPKDEISYTTLTQEKYDEISAHMEAISYGSSVAQAEDLASENAELAAESAVGTEQTYSGDGYSGSYTETLTGYEESATITLSDESCNYETYQLTVSGTMSQSSSFDMSIDESGMSVSMSGTYTMNLSISGGSISSISGSMNMSMSLSYTAEELAAMTEEPDMSPSISGTITVDGVNYRASEYAAFSEADSDY